MFYSISSPLLYDNCEGLEEFANLNVIIAIALSVVKSCAQITLEQDDFVLCTFEKSNTMQTHISNCLIIANILQKYLLILCELMMLC